MFIVVKAVIVTQHQEFRNNMILLETLENRSRLFGNVLLNAIVRSIYGLAAIIG